jgi:hypothetical protein
MRSQKRILVSGLVAIMALLLVFAGCSDDNTATSSGSGTNTGSLSDPEFVAVRAQIDAVADSTLDFFMHGLNALQGIDVTDLPAQYAVDPDGNDQVNTSYSDGWHVVGLTSLATGNSFWIRDSIQFVKNGTPQQSPSGLQSMNFIHRWFKDVQSGNTTDTASGRAQLSFGSFYQTNTTVSGTAQCGVYNKTIHSGDSTIVKAYDFDVTLTGFKIGQAGNPAWFSHFGDPSNCPCEGTIKADVTSTYQKNSNSATTTEWDVEATFSNGTLSVEVTSGNTVWQYTRDMCNPPSN